MCLYICYRGRMLQAGVEMFRLVGFHTFQRHPGLSDQLIMSQLVLVTHSQPAGTGNRKQDGKYQEERGNRKQDGKQERREDARGGKRKREMKQERKQETRWETEDKGGKKRRKEEMDEEKG